MKMNGHLFHTVKYTKKKHLNLPEKSVPFHKVGFHDAASSGLGSLHPHEHGEEHSPGLRQQVRKTDLAICLARYARLIFW